MEMHPSDAEVATVARAIVDELKTTGAFDRVELYSP